MKELIFNVNGMACGGCENRIKNAVKNIDGIEEVIADYKTGKVTVLLNKDIDRETISEVIDDIGFEVVKEG